MRAAAQVQAAIELLDESISTKFPADRIMSNYFRTRRYIGSGDRRAVGELFYKVLRNRLSLEYLATQNGLSPSAKILLATHLQSENKVLKDYFNGEKYSPKVLSVDVIEKLKQISVDQLEDAPSHVQLNVPEWLEQDFKQSLNDDYSAEMKSSARRASTDIRVNLLKSDLVKLQANLTQNGVQTHQTTLSPWGLRFENRVAVGNLDCFKKGWFEIQDEGSQLLALLANPKAGQTVVDFCAGAGGKTLAMAALMQNKGSLYACDVHTKRLEQLSKRAKRAGVHNVRMHTLSSEHDKWVKKHKGRADVVLVDAPCSGTGTWRRNPDSRWNLVPHDLENLVQLQASILQSASRLVKPGGRLIYATCSLLEQENQSQAVRFLTENAHFKAQALNLDVLPKALQSSSQDHQLRLLTSKHETDGFYLASFERDRTDATD